MDRKDTHVTTAIRGTIGHIGPEYLSTGKSSEKTDFFGYGVMLLELITGQRAFDLARLANDDEVMSLDWVKGLLNEEELKMLVDAEMQGNYVNEEVEGLIQVALLYTQRSAHHRPKMSEEVRMLEDRHWRRGGNNGRKMRCSAKSLALPNTKLLVGSLLIPLPTSAQINCPVPDDPSCSVISLCM
ncbi:hypothetical protein Vadar_032279 [Vaccinium darrowii]|uniref:Uncharacterized protein n=1 Tax=Vaccinium darrowii TaxID=229202 RepID=A0ACB7ZNY8_9ERIC|nr:hypothetical protein Vadar_032279 [Vaccinium darrowii]